MINYRKWAAGLVVWKVGKRTSGLKNYFQFAAVSVVQWSYLSVIYLLFVINLLFVLKVSWTSGLTSGQVDNYFSFIIYYLFVICLKSKLVKWFEKWGWQVFWKSICSLQQQQLFSKVIYLLSIFLLFFYNLFVICFKVSWTSSLKSRVD